MTIKNNGGIFGRNPTFNDVTIEGQLTFDGDIDVNSDLKVDGNLFVTGTGDFDGDLNVNAGSIVVDAGSVNITHPFDRALQINRSGANTFSLEHSTAEMYLYNATTASAVINFKNNSNVHINSGNLVFGTAGNGIDFSATSGTGTSELFDDYEEGTWTGTLIGDTTAPSSPVTATGTYTKIGRQVIVQISFDAKNTTGASGVMRVNGLPFTAGARGFGPTMKANMGAQNLTSFVSSGQDSVTFSEMSNMTTFTIGAASSIYLRFALMYSV
jgi:hypothetical protein